MKLTLKYEYIDDLETYPSYPDTDATWISVTKEYKSNALVFTKMCGDSDPNNRRPSDCFNEAWNFPESYGISTVFGDGDCFASKYPQLNQDEIQKLSDFRLPQINTEKLSEFNTAWEIVPPLHERTAQKKQDGTRISWIKSDTIEFTFECEPVSEQPEPVKINPLPNPVITMPIQSQISNQKFTVRKGDIVDLGTMYDADVHALWYWTLDITAEPSTPPLLQDNDGSKDYGIVKAKYGGYHSKSWQITENKTYSNMLELLPKNIKIKNWDEVKQDMQDMGVDIDLAIPLPVAGPKKSLAVKKATRIRDRVNRRNRKPDDIEAGALLTQTSAKEATSTKAESFTYQKKVPELNSDNTVVNDNTFFQQPDEIPTIQLQSVKLPSFDDPYGMRFDRKPKGIPAIPIAVGAATIISWGISLLSALWENMKTFVVIAVIQTAVNWLFEMIFTSGIDLFKELVVEKFLGDSIEFDDYQSGAYDTRRVHYELPRADMLEFNFRDGVEAELTIGVLFQTNISLDEFIGLKGNDNA